MTIEWTVSGATEGERSSTGVAPEVKHWSVNCKTVVVLRLMRGEPADVLSRQSGIEICRLEEWHSKAIQGIESALKAHEDDPLTERVHSVSNNSYQLC